MREVQVFSRETGEQVESIPADDIDDAREIAAGVRVNLNHEEYRVEIK